MDLGLCSSLDENMKSPNVGSYVNTNTNTDNGSKNKKNILNLDLRVSKGVGEKGYNMVRISVISDSRTDSDSRLDSNMVQGYKKRTLLEQLSNKSSVNFTYSSNFVHRWTDLHVKSGMYALDHNPSSTNGGKLYIYICINVYIHTNVYI